MIHHGNYIVGAYATSPNLFTWDEPSELEYFGYLKQLKAIRGLELPFWGESLHPADDQWLLTNLDSAWENVLTCVPGTMKRLAGDELFGLGSINEHSREDAIQFHLKALQAVNKMKNRFGEKSVHAIHITSSPRNTKNSQAGSVAAFTDSLKALVSWGWGKTRIVIEHCDTFNEINLKPHKGFLSLEEEIKAISQVNSSEGSNIGIVINWGRSAIETRKASGAAEQIEVANNHGVLRGIMFSGTTDKNSNEYGEWSDLHMPPAPYKDFQYGEPDSLLSFYEIKKSLAQCNLDKLEYIGIKLLAKPNTSSLKKRVGINQEAMMMIDDALDELST